MVSEYQDDVENINTLQEEALLRNLQASWCRSIKEASYKLFKIRNILPRSFDLLVTTSEELLWDNFVFMISLNSTEHSHTLSFCQGKVCTIIKFFAVCRAWRYCYDWEWTEPVSHDSGYKWNGRSRHSNDHPTWLPTRHIHILVWFLSQHLSEWTEQPALHILQAVNRRWHLNEQEQYPGSPSFNIN